MNHPTAATTDSNQTTRKPVTIARLHEMYANREPIVMVTAYDYPSARAVEDAGVDVVLVGDSAAMTVLGHSSTVPVTLEEMIMLCRAVRRGLKTPLLIGDLPFGTYESSDDLAIETAHRFVKDGGCDAVKLERGGRSIQRAKAIIESGIPVMGHVGLTPQSATSLGGYRVQGKTADSAYKLFEDTLGLQDAGCFSIVFEVVPAAVTEALIPLLEIPTIGIGAGPQTSGQVLVYHDLLGLLPIKSPKFLKQYAHLYPEIVAAIQSYADDVRERNFPSVQHSYSIADEEIEQLRAKLST